MLEGEQEGKRIQVRQEERQGGYSSERAPEREVNEGQFPERDTFHTEETAFAKAHRQKHSRSGWWH